MKTGAKITVAGVVVFLLGVIAVPTAIVLSFILHDSGETQFSIPGSISYTIKTPGRYYLWNDYQTVFQGMSYNRSKDIPDGISIVISDQQTGSRYAFTGNTSISSSSSGSARNSIGYIEAENTGTIVIDVTGGGEERIFSFSRFALGEFFGRVFGGIGLALLTCITGGGLISWGIVRLAREKKTAEQPPA